MDQMQSGAFKEITGWVVVEKQLIFLLPQKDIKIKLLVQPQVICVFIKWGYC